MDAPTSTSEKAADVVPLQGGKEGFVWREAFETLAGSATDPVPSLQLLDQHGDSALTAALKYDRAELAVEVLRLAPQLASIHDKVAAIVHSLLTSWFLFFLKAGKSASSLAAEHLSSKEDLCMVLGELLRAGIDPQQEPSESVWTSPEGLACQRRQRDEDHGAAIFRELQQGFERNMERSQRIAIYLIFLGQNLRNKAYIDLGSQVAVACGRSTYSDPTRYYPSELRDSRYPPPALSLLTRVQWQSSKQGMQGMKA